MKRIAGIIISFFFYPSLLLGDLIPMTSIDGTEKVVYDDASGLYWLGDQSAMLNKTLEQQKEAIIAMNSPGEEYFGMDNWMLATVDLVDTFTVKSIGGVVHGYDNTAMYEAFGKTGEAPTYHGGSFALYDRFWARMGTPAIPGHSLHATFAEPDWVGRPEYSPWGAPLWPWYPDNVPKPGLGAWVVSPIHVVPLPSAFLLGIMGLGIAGSKLRKRNH